MTEWLFKMSADKYKTMNKKYLCADMTLGLESRGLLHVWNSTPTHLIYSKVGME